MNRKLLAILVCIAMLVSCLSVYAYAAVVEVEIDLGGLFDDEPADEGNDSENKDSENGKDTKPGNNTSTKPGNTSGNNSGRVEDEDNEEDTSSEEKAPEKEEAWVNPFKDVKESDWFYNTVEYVNKNGIINGMTEDTFAPSTQLTRAMLVTILYRVEGSPRVSSDSKFSDVKDSDWYGAPIIWAAENEIVNGISETEFAPNNAITREQIAAIMFRYAKAKGYDVTQGGMAVREFEDYETISSWAREAMQWTVNAKLINGKTATTVNPQDNATRAEAATIIMRFIEGNK